MNLAFITPLLLAGLAAVAVPIVIHLISKRRARHVRFALVEILLRSQRRTARAIRLRQLLLLLLRVVLVACVAAAIAQPFLSAMRVSQASRVPLAVMIVLDATASMQASSDGTTVYAQARAAALDVVREQPADVRVGALLCAAPVRELASPTFERAALLSALESANVTFTTMDLNSCVARANVFVQSVVGDGERRIVVLSDLAAHAFVGATAAGPRADGTLVSWRAIGTATTNHALLDARVERTAARLSNGITVKMQAQAFGEADSADVDLLLDGARSARTRVTLNGNDVASAVFHAELPSSPANLGAVPKGGATGPTFAQVVLPPDALTVDDTIALALNIAGPLAVLIIDGAPQAVPFDDEVYYLNSALLTVRGGAARLRLTTLTPDQVTATHVTDARVIVLANVARLPDAVAVALREHVQAGAGLFITMGDQIDVDWMNAALADLLPARLRGEKGQTLLDDAAVAEVLAFAQFDVTHPALTGLAAASAGGVGDTTNDLAGLARVRTKTLMLVEPAPTAATSVLARFSNQTPALLERRVGAGRALTLLTSVDRDWSDLAIRPGFAPLMQQLVLYAGGALDDNQAQTLRVGEVRQIRVVAGTATLDVLAPDGTVTTLTVPAGASSVAFDATHTAGAYRVSSRMEGGDAVAQPAAGFTVLIAAAESDLRRAAPDTLTRALPAGAASDSHDDAHNDDTKLWPALLLLAALALCAEALLLRRTAT